MVFTFRPDGIFIHYLCGHAGQKSVLVLRIILFMLDCGGVLA